MKRTLQILFIPLILLIITAYGCSTSPDYHPQLVAADSLMQADPDSALHLLEAFPERRLQTEADRAYYALLLTHARDKNFIVQQDDSLILSAVRHYDATEETNLKARAYYLLGSVYRDMKNVPASVEAYLRAAPLAEESEELYLLGCIYNNVAYHYQTQGLYNQADSIYRLGEKLGVLLKDTVMQVEALLHQGNIHINHKRYSEAKELIHKSLNILGKYKHEALLADIFYMQSVICNIEKHFTEAIKNAKLGIALLQGGEHQYSLLVQLGEAYYKSRLYDSATYYFEKCLESSNYIDKSNAYMRLADIAKKQKNTTLSLKMERKYSAYKDSIRLINQAVKVLKKDETVRIIQQQQTYKQSNKNYYMIIALLLIGCLSFFILSYQLFKRNRAKNHIQRELKKELDEYCAYEQKKGTLQKEVDVLTKQRAELAQKKLENSDIYKKMERIIAFNKQNGFNKEELNENEWTVLMEEIDKSDTIQKLSLQYNLTIKEQHLCCLLFIDMPVIDRARIMNYQRQTLYRNETAILKKMGETYEVGKLQGILRNL